MLSTYSFMYPLRLLGKDPTKNEGMPLYKMLIRRLGIERGIIASWALEVLIMLVVFSAILYGAEFRPALYGLLVMFDASAIIAMWAILRVNFKAGEKYRREVEEKSKRN